VTDQSATVDWPAALQQIFAEPWRVRPAFQPIYDLERRAVWGFQVLARFISPLRATPPEWLAAAEQYGKREALEGRLLTAGLAAKRELPDHCHLLLPLSPAALLSSGVQQQLQRSVHLARNVVLDVTVGETDVNEFTMHIEHVRANGLGLALTAGSSPGGLDGLPRLRPDALKLGRDYIAGIDSDPARRAVVDGLAQLVGAIGGRLIAVGIEEAGQLAAVRAAGITLGQGFGLGRPVPSMAVPLTCGSASLLND
jgi:EAL domain-containing protein (putative c-di-GMP-specific phosphodiesterase class I)